MAATVESQRLISLSLGKIARSRGQRGGINLHKNLLVATVLHKARAAYMMESYQAQQQIIKQQEQPKPDLSCSEPSQSVCQPIASMEAEVGQAATPLLPCAEENGSTNAAAAAAGEPEVNDKENSAPAQPCLLANEGKDADHLTAATQLAQDAMTSDSGNQQTSGAPTCTGVLKRRRENPNTSSSFEDSPVVKKAKVSCASEVSSPSPSLSSSHHVQQLTLLAPCQFTALNSDDSDSDAESDYEVCSMVQQSDSPQISNLVSIFNSGFAGLCATNNNHISEEHKFTSLSTLRPESPTPTSKYSRKMSEPSLMCSTEVGRMGSLPSAIVLSA